MKTARIAEIFESFQGEGIYIGVKQLFVRFFGCNLACAFCDTPLTRFKEYTSEELREEILRYHGYHSLALTGGEPLYQVDFLEEFLEGLRDLKIKVYLETNGVLTAELKKIREFIDIIAMDFKLPSSTKKKPHWERHGDFLKACLEKEVFVKMVIAKATKKKDLLTAAGIIKKIKADIPVVLQPNWFDMDMGLLKKLDSFKKDLLRSGLTRTRILHQAHKYAGIR